MIERMRPGCGLSSISINTKYKYQGVYRKIHNLDVIYFSTLPNHSDHPHIVAEVLWGKAGE